MFAPLVACRLNDPKIPFSISISKATQLIPQRTTSAVMLCCFLFVLQQVQVRHKSVEVRIVAAAAVVASNPFAIRTPTILTLYIAPKVRHLHTHSACVLVFAFVISYSMCSEAAAADPADCLPTVWIFGAVVVEDVIVVVIVVAL